MKRGKAEQSFRKAELILKYLRRDLSPAEEIQLARWLGSRHNAELFNELTDPEELQNAMEAGRIYSAEIAWQRVRSKIQANRPAKSGRMLWIRYAAAVLILAVLGFLITSRFNEQPAIPDTAGWYGEDILPGIRQARLTLSDGSNILLQSGKNSVIMDNGSRIYYSEAGAITYENSNHAVYSEVKNTLRVPKAGEYLVELSDGTKVWLNAATSIRYPLAFGKGKRVVELLEGEAYFEIFPDSDKPFIVRTAQMNIQAIGTAFNISAYTSVGRSVTTTLTEGKVKVDGGQKTVFLKPGERVKATTSGLMKQDADTEMVLAWKNRLFMFKNSPLEDVAQQIENWYNVEVNIDKSLKGRKFFTGEIKRNVPLSQLIRMLELTGIGRFRIEKKTINILPATTGQ